MSARPEKADAAPYYFTYIDQVGDGDICDLLDAQRRDALALLRGISEEKSRHRYEAGKWSLREVVNHINDAERLFVFRAFWFARGFDSPLPSFDQNVAVAAANVDGRSWRDLVEEFDAVRAATLAFFRTLPDAAWSRRGIASDNPFSVRAMAYITAGHVAHHLKIVKERY